MNAIGRTIMLFLPLSLLVVTVQLPGAGGAEPGVPLPLSTVEQWGVRELSIESASFTVEYGGGNTFVRAEVFGPPGANVVVTRSNGALSIRVDEPAPLRLEASGSIRVFGPETLALSVKTERGEIRIRDLVEADVSVVTEEADSTLEEVSGQVELHSTAGSVHLKDLDGSATVESDTGNVTLELSHGSFAVRTEAGAIRLFDVEGSFDLESESGSIRGSSIAITEDSRLRSKHGEIEIDVSTPQRALRYRLSSEHGALYLGALKAQGNLRFGSGSTLVTAASESSDIRFY